MLTILVTGAPLAGQDSTDCLRRLSRGRPLDSRSLTDIDDLRRTPLEHWLTEAFAIPGEAAVSAYAALADSSAAPSSDSLVLSPVHLRATLDHLVLHTSSELGLTLDEAHALADTANAHFEADGLTLTPLSARLWSLTGAHDLQALDLASSDAARGRNIDHYMPAGPAGRRARALLNELQMLWFSHPVNDSRAQAGLPTVNSLWFEGRCAPLHGRPHETVLATDPRIQGLAQAVAARFAEPGDPTHLVAQVREALTRGPTLLALDAGDEDRLGLFAAGGRWPADSRIVFVDDSGWRMHLLLPSGLLARLRRWRP
ncbi:MAG: hypothetical protein R3E83_19180 [Burkholderiaceae bacterium]